MKLIHLAIVAVVLAGFVMPIDGNAAGIVVPGGPSVFDGSRTISADTVSPPDPGTSETNYSTQFEPNRSYACAVVGESNQSNLDIINITDPNGNAVLVVPIGNVSPAIAGDFGDTNNNRVSITPSGSGSQIAGTYSVAVANQTVVSSTTTSAPAKARFDCFETTLYGGYNTNVNDFNFLEITNTTNATITGAITATNSDGTVVINKQAFAVASNRRIDVDLHTPAGSSKFGLVQLTHNGPYGALQAYVSQYDGTVSNFIQTASIPLRPRDR